MVRSFPAVLLALIAAASAFPAVAAELENFERILLPIMTQPIPGLFGSGWVSEFSVQNHSSSRVRFTVEGFDCGIAQCALLGVGPGETYRGTPWRVAASGEPPGVLVYAERPHSSQLSFSLTVHETTRGVSTAIPVVREGEFRKGAIQLPNVPLGPGVRQTLRIYDPDAQGQSRVLVNFFSSGSSPQAPPIASLVLQLSTPSNNIFQNFGWPYQPGYAQISSFVEKIRQLETIDSVRIEIQPLTPGLRYWAFVSVTNNQTQQVTLITPQ